MLKRHAVFFCLWMGLVFAFTGCRPPEPVPPRLDLSVLSEEQKKLVDDIRSKLDGTLESKKKDGGILVLAFGELYAPLNENERRFLDAIRRLKPEDFESHSTHFTTSTEGVEWIRLENQAIHPPGGEERILDPQMIPKEVWLAYQAMNEAMQQDIGKRLFVESGYRSPAYQLYLIITYLPKHGYSLRETKRFVALPGQSEHGSPEHQALDFINEEGINGEDHPEEFENLPEYKWLTDHTAEYGFILSYPRGYNWAFEPWHWHYSRKWAEKGKKVKP